MTTADEILARHISGQETLASPSALAKVRQGQDWEHLEGERLAQAAADAEQARLDAEREEAGRQYDTDVTALRDLLAAGQRAYGTALDARRELDRILTEYRREQARLVKQAGRLDRDPSELPPRVGPDFIRQDLDRESRRMAPRYRHAFRPPTTTDGPGQPTP